VGNHPVFFMHIYLRHPKHGTKVAIAEAEAVADERNGWVRYTLGEPDAPVNELEAKRRRRPAA
jgi:hypothetical protein